MACDGASITPIIVPEAVVLSYIVIRVPDGELSVILCKVPAPIFKVFVEALVILEYFGAVISLPSLRRELAHTSIEPLVTPEDEFSEVNVMGVEKSAQSLDVVGVNLCIKTPSI